MVIGVFSGVIITKVGEFYNLIARNGDDEVRVKWDAGSTVYVTLEGDHSDGVSGLCGNYDDDATIPSESAPTLYNLLSILA